MNTMNYKKIFEKITFALGFLLYGFWGIGSLVMFIKAIVDYCSK